MVSFLTRLVTASYLSLGILSSQVHGQNITNDTYFYGQSESVLPSPQMPGRLSWQTAHAKAVALVSQMTLAERANITVGYTPTTGCSGVTGTVPRLGWHGLCLADAGQGLRAADFVNAYPAGNSVGSSWNKALTLQRATHMAAEFKRKGVHVLLGPMIGPLGRVALGGRNWEGFSNDPYLAGSLVYDTIKGIQSAGVIASVKHFIGNEQEVNRNPIRSAASGGIGGASGLGSAVPGNFSQTVESLSSNIDDKTMHEMYLWPFADAIHAGSASVMCSYQRINNSYGCQNQKAQNGLLKTELGFEGFVVSDWGAQHAGVASAEGGLDLVMPTGNAFWGVGGNNLTTFVQNGSLPEARLTDMATRIVAAWFQLGQDKDFPPVGLPLQYNVSHKAVNARDPASKPILLQGAIEGHVLVKNVNKTLPFQKPKLLSLFGYDAVAPRRANIVDPNGNYQFGFLLNSEFYWRDAFRYPFSNPGQIGPNGTLIVGGGSGGTAPAYISSPYDALQDRAYQDGFQLFWDFHSSAPMVDQSSDACLVFINAFATEGVDRLGLHDDYSDDIILNVASACSNTIVVIHNAGIRLVDTWIDHPNITAVMFAHLPGQDAGRAVVSLLFGDESPSGKMTYTVARNESDYNVPIARPSDEFFYFPQDNFTEGVYIDYRDFDRRNITPRYEFGFGLTYTTFEYSDLSVSLVQNASTSYNAPQSPMIEGGMESLWDVIATVGAVVTNTGDVTAKEVAQLYVHIPGGPIRQLRGFDKVEIAPGKSETVRFTLLRRDISEWDVTKQAWVLQQGTYSVWVGASSRNLPLSGELTVG
ncbi:putative beta-glucosidase M [Cadophora sp. MPI-SDFR-AT-0126]|nr:putative beta-glucosidase M [Leotiomycetes sp. MPI-SDFR-AT-0126]